RKLGAIVENAENAQEAFLKVKKANFDIILMDVQMPEINGIEAMQQIRKMNLKKMPKILALTAYAMQEDQTKLLAQGFDGYIAKPIKIDILYRKLVGSEEKTEIIEKNIRNLFDTSVWDTLANIGGTDLVQESLQEGIQEAQELIAALQEAYQQKNFAKMKEILHTLKGATATLGLVGFAETCRIWEQALLKNPADDFSENKLNFLHIWDETLRQYPQIWQNWLEKTSGKFH
ncbi:MAG: response regulator, partial [Raineya sp.]